MKYLEAFYCFIMFSLTMYRTVSFKIPSSLSIIHRSLLPSVSFSISRHSLSPPSAFFSSGPGDGDNFSKKSGNGFGKPNQQMPSIDAIAKQLQMSKDLRDKVIGGGGAGTSSASSPTGPDGKKMGFEDLIKEFPSKFTIKVIGTNDPSFAIDIINSVAATIAVTPEEIQVSTRDTKGGQWLSISITPTFKSAAEIYKVYDVLGQDSRVKFVI